MEKMNILLTSAGRRGYLVEYFNKEFEGVGTVFVGNSSALAPSFYYAKKQVVTPLIYDDNYIPFLLEYCKANEIKAIISLFDIDLMILAKNKQLFKENGITVIVSDESVIDICNDKWNTYQFCVKNNFKAPRTYIKENDILDALKEGEISYPVVVKPRWGMGSIAVYIANDEEELRVFSKKVRKEIFDTYLKYESSVDVEECVLFQEMLKGDEHGLDVVHDLNRNHMTTVVRRKLAMRSGETDSAKVIKDDVIASFGKAVGDKLGHVGNLDMDIFLCEGEPYVLELNARFGGGYPFSHSSGLNLPRAIKKWLLKEPLTDELEIKKYNHTFQKDIQMIDMTEFFQ